MRDDQVSMRLWTYYFKHAFINIMNNRLTHLISMSTIAISMLLFGTFILLYVNLDNWIREWGESLSMSVYLKEDINEDIKNHIESTLEQIEGAEIKEYISKEQALTQLKKALGTQAGLLDGLRKNPLPGSFEIVFSDVSSQELDPRKIKDSLEKIQGVDEVQYSEQWMDRFKGLMYVFKVVGFIIGGFLCIAVLFISTNTIKLAIYARRDELEIYKLVGATDWFVKMPFLIEGAVQGVVGGLIAFLALLLGYSLFKLESVHLFGLPVLEMIFLSGQHAVFIILLSILLGLFGGFIAVGRFFLE